MRYFAQQINAYFSLISLWCDLHTFIILYFQTIIIHAHVHFFLRYLRDQTIIYNDDMIASYLFVFSLFTYSFLLHSFALF